MKEVDLSMCGLQSLSQGRPNISGVGALKWCKAKLSCDGYQKDIVAPGQYTDTGKKLYIKGKYVFWFRKRLGG